TFVFRQLSSYRSSFLTAHVSTDIFTLSLHDALPIWRISSATGKCRSRSIRRRSCRSYRRVLRWLLRTSPLAGISYRKPSSHATRSEEHTSELQSREKLVCRLLLEKNIFFILLRFSDV